MQLVEVFVSLQRAPDDPRMLSVLERALRTPGAELTGYYHAYQSDCYAALARVLPRGVSVSQELWSLAAAQVRARHHIDGSAVQVTTELLTALATDELCKLVLSETVNTNLELERCLTHARRLLLGLRSQGRLAESFRPLLVALAQQAYNNEYAWAVSDSEEAEVAAISSELGIALRAEQFSAAEIPLLLYCLYKPIAVHPEADQLAGVDISQLPSDLQPLITRSLLDPRYEAYLRKCIPTLGTIENSVSRSVRAQYEESPYPRWMRLTQEPSLSVEESLQLRNPEFAWPSGFRSQSLNILVAGCGTGQQSLRLALDNPEAEVLAVDLSSASLAYAIRMTEQYGINNISFLQGDLLSLPQLGRKFHHIACVGVLHHIRDHVAAWSVLNECLHPGGTMKIGVYSKFARVLVNHVRARIQQERIGATPAEVRHFRARLLTEPEWESVVSELAQAKDFFALSMVRDLLFHVQEHQYTISEIEGICAKLKLELVGVDVPRALRERAGVMPLVERRVANFSQWRSLERAYAGSLTMFLFWLRKITPK